MGENTNRSEPFFDEDVDLVKLQFTDIFGQCKMVQMTRRQAEKAMKEGYAINRFALGGLQKAGTVSYTHLPTQAMKMCARRSHSR